MTPVSGLGRLHVPKSRAVLASLWERERGPKFSHEAKEVWRIADHGIYRIPRHRCHDLYAVTFKYLGCQWLVPLGYCLWFK
jgi:hypothetical protein